MIKRHREGNGGIQPLRNRRGTGVISAISSPACLLLIETY